MKAPPCPTAHKALAAAITKAMEEPLDGRLTEAHFGRYAAEGAGWNFRLVFLREVGDADQARLRPDDSLARRVEFIIGCWERSWAVRDALAACQGGQGEGEER